MDASGPFDEAKTQILSAFPHYSKSQIWQLQAIRALWIILLAIHISMVAISFRRSRKGLERFWVFRIIRRSRGVYLVPNAVMGWCLPAIAFCGSQIVAISLQIVGALPAHRYLAVSSLLLTACPILLVFSFGLSAGALVFSVLATAEDAGHHPLRFLLWTRRLPRPIVFHLILYGYLIAWLAVVLGLGAWSYLAGSELYDGLDTLLGILTGLSIGNVSADALVQASTVGQAVQDLAPAYKQRSQSCLITHLVFGTVSVILYVPFACTLVWQLRNMTLKRSSPPYAGNTSAMTSSQSSTRSFTLSRYHLIGAHAVLFAFWSSTQMSIGYYELFALHADQNIDVAVFVQLWAMLVCAYLFAGILLAYMFLQSRAARSQPTLDDGAPAKGSKTPGTHVRSAEETTSRPKMVPRPTVLYFQRHDADLLEIDGLEETPATTPTSDKPPMGPHHRPSLIALDSEKELLV